MEKRKYSVPQTEVVKMVGGCQVMKTSQPLPPDGAPKKRGDIIY